MKKPFVCYLISFFSLCLLSGCHRQELPHSALLYADSLIELYPDSTLFYLKNLDVSRFSKSDKVYYGLLLTQATDKNYLPLLPCDSLVDVALDYYDEGDGLLRAKALLYKNRIQQSMQMPKEAMENCFEGLKELGDSPKELRLKSMLYEDLGGIYQEQDLPDDALKMFQLAYHCDSLLKDEKLLKYSVANIGWQYVILGKEEVAKQYLNNALLLGTEQKDSLFVSNIYKQLSINCENIDSAFAHIHLAECYQTDRSDSIELFLLLGELFLKKQELDSGDYYLKKVLNNSGLHQKMLAYYSLSELEKERGNYLQALEYRSFYGENIDTIFAMNRASGIERLAYKYEAGVELVKERSKTEQIIQMGTFSIVVLLLICLLIIQYIYRRKKISKLMYEQHISHLKEQIALQQASIESSKKDLIKLQLAQEQNKEEIALKVQEIALKEQEIRKMINEKAGLRNCFFKQTPIYKKIEALKNQENFGSKEAQVLLYDDHILLKDTLFQIYAEYVNYLQSTFPKLTENDHIYFCLKLCDLDDQTMAYCYGNINKQMVVQRRSRLKGKMEVIS